jgi:hypothetical protein
MDAVKAERQWSALVTRARDGVLGVVPKLRTRWPDVTPGLLVTLETLLVECLENLARGHTGPGVPEEETAHATPTNGGPPSLRRRRLARPTP